MLISFIFWIILHLILSVIANQTMTLLPKKSNDLGTLAFLVEIGTGVFTLLLSIFYKFTIPTNISFYALLILSCIFYAISDRANMTVRKRVDAGTFSIISQTSTFFLTILGFIFLKESFVLTKFIGAFLIIFSNVFIFYEKDKFKINKYVLFGFLARLSYTIGLF